MSDETKQIPAGVAVGRVGDSHRPTELDRLEVFIGRWMTEGETVSGTDSPSMPIVASDIYQWLPGRRFVMHPAYGRIGSADVGGLEVIGYDAKSGNYVTYFFDSEGHVSSQALRYNDGTWTWEDEHARCTGVFSDRGKTLVARHERSDDGVNWTASMNVTLRKVD